MRSCATIARRCCSSPAVRITSSRSRCTSRRPSTITSSRRSPTFTSSPAATIGPALRRAGRKWPTALWSGAQERPVGVAHSPHPHAPHTRRRPDSPGGARRLADPDRSHVRPTGAALPVRLGHVVTQRRPRRWSCPHRPVRADRTAALHHDGDRGGRVAVRTAAQSRDSGALRGLAALPGARGATECCARRLTGRRCTACAARRCVRASPGSCSVARGRRDRRTPHPPGPGPPCR